LFTVPTFARNAPIVIHVACAELALKEVTALPSKLVNSAGIEDIQAFLMKRGDEYSGQPVPY